MTIKEQLDGLRGGDYFGVWRNWWTSHGPSIKDEINAIVTLTGTFTPAQLIAVNDKHELPFKTFVEQLENDQILPIGTYGRLPAIGKMRKMLATEG